MMKPFSIFFCVAILFSCEKPPKDSYHIKAKAPGIYNGMRAYLKVSDERQRFVNVDTAIVMDEKFSFDGKRDEPRLEYLFIDNYEGHLPLIVENGDIEIQINKDSLFASKIIGSKENDAYKAFSEEERKLTLRAIELQKSQRTARQTNNTIEFGQLTNDLKQTTDDLKNLPMRFINGKEDSFLSVILLNKMTNTNGVALDSIEVGYNKLSANLKASSYGQKIGSFIDQQKLIREQQKATQIGGTAPNFSANTPEGKTLALNDIKGKLTLIDFWASWCGPCRRENPNVVKVYNKYHDKGLEIISVSLDRNGQKDRWIKAINDDKMTWHHISNLQYWQDPIAKIYNVRSIPATFLLDAEGKIVAKNLRGSALEDKVAELLN